VYSDAGIAKREALAVACGRLRDVLDRCETERRNRRTGVATPTVSQRADQACRLTHLQRINSAFRDWRICLTPGRAFDLGSNCAAGPGMRMQTVVAHVKRVTIRVCDAFQPVLSTLPGAGLPGSLPDPSGGRRDATLEHRPSPHLWRWRLSAIAAVVARAKFEAARCGSAA
jgi:hypothetical protein